MSPRFESFSAHTLKVGAIAGISGGLAEVAWIAFYSASTGAPTQPVIRGIVVTLMPALAASSWSIPVGILIHSGLAFALGLGLAVVVTQFARCGRFSGFGLVMLALAAVWAVNFLIALPYLNPEFVRLLPYEVTLLSKLLFGLSAAVVLSVDRRRTYVHGR